MPANLENSAVATGLEKVSFIPIPQKKAMQKNVQTAQLHSSHMLVKLKILQARHQQNVNCELPDVQAGFRKGRGPIKINNLIKKKKRQGNQRSDCHHLLDHWKRREFQENVYICFIDYTKALDWITTKCGKFFKRWEYQTTLAASWKICMQVKKQQLEPDMEQ